MNESSTTTGAIDPELRRALGDAVGEQGLRSDEEDLAYFGSDRCRGAWPVAPSIVVLPASVQEVRAVVRACAAHGASIVPSGGRTGLAGAATASRGEVVVSLQRMNRILEVDPAARTLHCQAGATVEAVQEAAAKVGLLYPVDFAAKGTAQVGGSIATNAGGVKVIRYGGTRQWVAGLVAVLASSEVVELGGPLIKDNTGYDLRQLFVGAEGTLGIVVEATLRLCSPPAGSVVALCSVPDDERVIDVFTRVQGQMLLQAFECFDAASLQHVLEHRRISGPGPLSTSGAQHVLVEVESQGRTDAAIEATTDALTECLAEAQEAGEILDAVLASTPAQAKELWALREDISESLHRHRPHKADVALPLGSLMPFLRRWRARVAQRIPGARPVIFGHVGDGNLHLNLLPPPDADHDAFVEQCHALDDDTYALVHEYRGSISAEHGIGLLKRGHLHQSRSPAEIEMMRAIKRALDPAGLFNPGKIFAP